MRNDKETKIRNVKNNNGQILTEDDEIMNRQREYFTDLYNSNSENINTNNSVLEIEETARETPVTENELINVIKMLKNGKATGIDNITTEMVKNLDERGREVWLALINKIIEKQYVPREWNTSLIQKRR